MPLQPAGAESRSLSRFQQTATAAHPLGRVVVDQPLRDATVEHLPERLRRFEPVPLGNCQMPRIHVLR